MSRKTRNILLVVLATPCVFVFGMAAFANWWFGGNIKPSLDAQYIPTAQAFMQRPAGIPNFIYDIYPVPGSKIERGQLVCVTVDAPRLDAAPYDFSNWTRFYINNERAPSRGVSIVGPLLPGGAYEMPQFCIGPELERGLHLFEIRVSTSPTVLINPAEARTYTWAYRVE